MLADIKSELISYINEQSPAEQRRLNALLAQFDSLPPAIRKQLENCLIPTDPPEDTPYARHEDEGDHASGEFANAKLASTLMAGVPDRIRFPVIYCYGDALGRDFKRAVDLCQVRFNTLKKSPPSSSPYQDMAIMVFSHHWLCITLRFYYDEAKKTDAFVFNSTGKTYEGDMTALTPRESIWNRLQGKVTVYTNIERLQFDITSCYVFCTEFLFNYARADRYLATPFFDVISKAPYRVIDGYHYTECRLPGYFRRSVQSYDERAGVLRKDAPKEDHPVSKRGENFAQSVARYTRRVRTSGEGATVKEVNHRIHVKKLRWWFKTLKRAVDQKLTELPAPVILENFQRRTHLIRLAQIACELPRVAARDKALFRQFIPRLNTQEPIDQASVVRLFVNLWAVPEFIERVASEHAMCLFLFAPIGNVDPDLLAEIRERVITKLKFNNDNAAKLLFYMAYNKTYRPSMLKKVNFLELDNHKCLSVLTRVFLVNTSPSKPELAILWQCLHESRTIDALDAELLIGALCRDNALRRLTPGELEKLKPLFNHRLIHSSRKPRLITTILVQNNPYIDWPFIQRILLLNPRLLASDVEHLVQQSLSPTAYTALLLGLIQHCNQPAAGSSTAPVQIDMQYQAPNIAYTVRTLDFASAEELYKLPLTVCYHAQAHTLLKAYFACRAARKVFPIKFTLTLPDISSVITLELRSSSPQHIDDLCQLIRSLPPSDQRTICQAVPKELHPKAHSLRLWSNHLTRITMSKRVRETEPGVAVTRRPSATASMLVTTTDWADAPSSDTAGGGSGSSSTAVRPGAGAGRPSNPLDWEIDMQTGEMDLEPNLLTEPLPEDLAKMIDRDSHPSMYSGLFHSPQPEAATTSKSTDSTPRDPSVHPAVRQRV